MYFYQAKSRVESKFWCIDKYDFIDQNICYFKNIWSSRISYKAVASVEYKLTLNNTRKDALFLNYLILLELIFGQKPNWTNPYSRPVKLNYILPITLHKIKLFNFLDFHFTFLVDNKTNLLFLSIPLPIKLNFENYLTISNSYQRIFKKPINIVLILRTFNI